MSLITLLQKLFPCCGLLQSTFLTYCITTNSITNKIECGFNFSFPLSLDALFLLVKSLTLSRSIAKVSFCCSRIECCFAFRWLCAGGLEVAFRGVDQPQYLMD